MSPSQDEQEQRKQKNLILQLQDQKLKLLESNAKSEAERELLSKLYYDENNRNTNNVTTTYPLEGSKEFNDLLMVNIKEADKVSKNASLIMRNEELCMDDRILAGLYATGELLEKFGMFIYLIVSI